MIVPEFKLGEYQNYVGQNHIAQYIKKFQRLDMNTRRLVISLAGNLIHARERLIDINNLNDDMVLNMVLQFPEMSNITKALIEDYKGFYALDTELAQLTNTLCTN